jgi:RNA polymerase sigma-54 factor
MRILSDTWDAFEKMRIPEIARKLGVTPQEVQEAIEVLRQLNPRPGSQITQKASATVIPDLIVEKVDGKFVVTLNDRNIPSLHISRSYSELIRRGSKAKREVKDYVREKLNGATWLIRAIEQRKATMLRVTHAIIERQMDFFEQGPPNLNPLKLQDVADMVEMHISTISRVTNGKYAQTPHGIYELKYFFTEGLSRGDDGEDVSTERIRTRIRELVDNEPPEKPLSDQRIADQLAKEGYSVARRTVAKYREQLKILPARLRTRYT